VEDLGLAEYLSWPVISILKKYTRERKVGSYKGIFFCPNDLVSIFEDGIVVNNNYKLNGTERVKLERNGEING